MTEDSASPPRPRVVVSQCLHGVACRYDETSVPSPFVARLAQVADLIPVCPEVEIGLGIPRATIRIERDRVAAAAGGIESEPPPKFRDRLVQPSSGRDLTEAMRSFARGFLESVGRVDAFILKARSPSCGIDDTKLFDSGGLLLPETTAGLFAREVLERFPGTIVEDEEHLENPITQERFMERLLSAAARRARSSNTSRPHDLPGSP